MVTIRATISRTTATDRKMKQRLLVDVLVFLLVTMDDPASFMSAMDPPRIGNQPGKW